MQSHNDSWSLQNDYRNSEKWRIRVDTHEKYTEPKIDFVAWIMGLYPWRGDEIVLDVGSGPGQYYPRLAEQQSGVQYYGVDFSSGMLAEHDADGQLARASMLQLPFPDNSFDVVMANHVLYLASDIDAALAETRRVLKPGGSFIAATNSQQSMPQFKELFRRAILLVSPPGTSRDIRVPSPMHNRFALENGTRMLSQHYFAVVRHDLPSALVFNEVDPIMEYLESIRNTREPQLPSTVSWEQVMMIMREQCTNLIATLGELVIDKLSGVLIASDSGGFIEDFVTRRNGGTPPDA